MPYTVDGDYVEYGFDGYDQDGDPVYKAPKTGDDMRPIIYSLMDRVNALEQMFLDAHENNPALKDAWEKYLTIRNLSK